MSLGQKTVLVTGGGGFLGKAVCKELLQYGYKVRSLARSSYPELERWGVECLRGDITKKSDVEKAVRGVDGIIHTAALAGIWGKKEWYESVNIGGTQNLIAALESEKTNGEHKPCMIFTSSPSVVFNGESLLGGDENLPYARKDYAPYPATKRDSEKMFIRSCMEKKIEGVALRPHLIWGPDDPHFIPGILKRAAKGKMPWVGPPGLKVDTIFVDNAARAHRMALEALWEGKGISGRAYFLGQESPQDSWGFLTRLAGAAGFHGFTQKKIPMRFALIIGGLFELIYRAMGWMDKEPPLTRFLVMQMGTSHYFSHAAAKRDFGWEPHISTEEGYAILAGYFQNKAEISS